MVQASYQIIDFLDLTKFSPPQWVSPNYLTLLILKVTVENQSLVHHTCLMAQGYMTSVFVFVSFFWLVMIFCYFANLFQRRKACELNPPETVCHSLHIFQSQYLVLAYQFWKMHWCNTQLLI